MDGAQVGVLKETNQISLTGFLQCHDGGALEAEVGLEVLGNLSDETLERQLPNEKLSGFLIPSDLTESNSSRPVSVGLLDSAGGRGGLSCSLDSELLPWGFASGRLASGLFGTGHCDRQ